MLWENATTQTNYVSVRNNIPIPNKYFKVNPQIFLKNLNFYWLI